MSATLGALIDERRAAVVGRERERAALAALLAPGGPLLAIVHGIAGSGKSATPRSACGCSTTGCAARSCPRCRRTHGS